MKFAILKGLCACSLVLSLSTLDAGSCSKENNDDPSQKSQMMRSKNTHNREVKEQKQSGEWGAKMPASHGCSSNEGFVMSLEYMIMRAYQPNMAYAFEKKNIQKDTLDQGLSPGNAQSLLSKGNIVRPNRTWRPGFKLNLGWNTPYDLWDLQSEWTYYYNKSVTDRSTDDFLLSATLSNTEEGFIPYWALPNANATSSTIPDAVIATYTQLQGVWQLNYNMINLELGRSLYLTKALALRPHFGLQNGWIHQKSNVIYARSLSFLSAADRPVDQLVKMKNKFWGLGMRAGISGQWQLGAGFSVLGKLAGSILSGRTNASTSQYSAINNSIAGIDSGGYTQIYQDTDRIRQLAPGLESSLGLEWGTCMGSDTMYFGLTMSWESMYWWGQFRFIQPEYIQHAGNGSNYSYRNAHYNKYPFSDGALNIEGVTIRAKFDF